MKIHPHLYKNTCAAIILFGILALVGCASAPIEVLQPVGPKPRDAEQSKPLLGYLKVYSNTESYNDGDVMYYPHSGYSIYTNERKRIKIVANHISNNDETPEVVPIPIGNYYILAQSEVDGLVHVPVIIKAGRVTVVNLEASSRKCDTDVQGVEVSRAVKSSSGHVIGWKAES